MVDALAPMGVTVSDVTNDELAKTHARYLLGERMIESWINKLIFASSDRDLGGISMASRRYLRREIGRARGRARDPVRVPRAARITRELPLGPSRRLVRLDAALSQPRRAGGVVRVSCYIPPDKTGTRLAKDPHTRGGRSAHVCMRRAGGQGACGDTRSRRPGGGV